MLQGNKLSLVYRQKSGGQTKKKRQKRRQFGGEYVVRMSDAAVVRQTKLNNIIFAWEIMYVWLEMKNFQPDNAGSHFIRLASPYTAKTLFYL